MKSLHIDYREVDLLIPYARNARTHSDEQIASIAASIREFGFNNPVLVDGHRGVIAGHGRILAARQLGMDELPVIELAHLSDNQKRAFILAENKLTERAGWDQELLSLELAELDAAGFDLELTGFEAGEIETLLSGTEEDAELAINEKADEIPDTPVQPVSRNGDVWQIGSHRLICGSAADPHVVATLMSAEQARLCFTSPIRQSA